MEKMEHVIELEEKVWDTDDIVENTVDPLIINLQW